MPGMTYDWLLKIFYFIPFNYILFEIPGFFIDINSLTRNYAVQNPEKIWIMSFYNIFRIPFL